MTIQLFTDGSCSKNGSKENFGGYAVILTINNKSVKIYKESKSNTTNNEMEMMAVLQAIKIAKILTKTNKRIKVKDFNKLPSFKRLYKCEITKLQIYEIPTLKSGIKNIYNSPKIKSVKLKPAKIKYKAKYGANNKNTKKKSNKYLFSVLDKIISLFFIGKDNKKSVSSFFGVAE